jgi:hypothetical protein
MKEIKIVHMEQPLRKEDEGDKNVRLMTVDVMYYEVNPQRKRLPRPKVRRLAIWDNSRDYYMDEEEKQLWTKARTYYDEHLA